MSNFSVLPQNVQLPKVLSTELTKDFFTGPISVRPVFIEAVSLKSIHGDEALDAEIAVESMRTHLVLFQILRPCETLRTDWTHIVPICIQVLLVMLTCVLFQLVPADKAVVAIYFVAGKFVFHHLVLGHPGHGRKEEPTERARELLLLARKL